MKLHSLVFAAFSIGQLIASPVAGWLFNRTTARLPMICSAVIMLIANLLYALAQNSWQLLISRFLVGLGAGNATVARAYIGKCCTPENGELTKMMALLSASQAVGFIIGPLFGLLFVDISWNVIEVAGQPDQPHWKVVVDKVCVRSFYFIHCYVNVSGFLEYVSWIFCCHTNTGQHIAFYHQLQRIQSTGS